MVVWTLRNIISKFEDMNAQFISFGT